jgi:hypothetical protein
MTAQRLAVPGSGASAVLSAGGGTVANVLPVTACPSCGSDLVQPLRWEQKTEAQVLVEMRCPECSTWMQACHTPAEMEVLDRRQSAAREAILSAYELSVQESMSALAAHLHEALERDLIGADDFRPPRAA